MNDYPIFRHIQLMDHFDNDLKTGDVTCLISDWEPYFPLFPVKRKDGKRAWFTRIYRRRVMVYTGFIDEPEWQYGTIFDVLRDEENIDKLSNYME